jgi:hypothetical protein
VRVQNMRESSGNPRRRIATLTSVEQRFRNFLCSITATSHKSFGIGATTGGRHRTGHTELLCGLISCVDVPISLLTLHKTATECVALSSIAFRAPARTSPSRYLVDRTQSSASPTELAHTLLLASLDWPRRAGVTYVRGGFN